MDANNIGILVISAFFLLAISVTSFLILLSEVRMNKKRDEVNKQQLKEVIDRVEELINEIKK